MALTDEEKARVRTYLGYPDTDRVSSSYVGIDNALRAITPEGEVILREYLVKLDSLKAEIVKNWPCLKVTSVVGEVTMDGHRAIRTLRAEGNRIVADLGKLLGIRPIGTPFGGSSGPHITGWG